MKNIWTRHLETATVMKESEENPFLARLQVSDDHGNPCIQELLINRTLEEETKREIEPLEVIPSSEVSEGTQQQGENFTEIENELPDVVKAGDFVQRNRTVEDIRDYTGEGVELMQWTSKSHKGHDLRLNTYPDDVVRLIELTNGKLFLQYSISGDNTENVPVDSVKEAEAIIEEDNDTTEELYPNTPDLQWGKTC